MSILIEREEGSIFANAVSQLETQDYILEQKGWNLALFEAVSWDSLDTAMPHHKGARRNAAAKLQFRRWATLARRKRRGESIFDTRCPPLSHLPCGRLRHVLYCSAPGTITARTASLVSPSSTRS
jgi:hypothetical protein